MALPNFRKGVVTSKEGVSCSEVARCEVYSNDYYWWSSGCSAFTSPDHKRMLVMGKQSGKSTS